MAYKYPKQNGRSGSTTWTVSVDRIAKDPAPQATRRRRRPSFHAVSRRDPKVPVTIQVRYRGGGEAWWFVEGRGRAQAFPGHTSLHEVLSYVNGTWSQGDPDA